MLKKIGLYCLFLLFIAACGQNDVVKNGSQPVSGIVKAQVVSLFRADETARNNVFYSSAYYKGRYYYLERRAEKYVIHVKDLQGCLLDKIEILKGKGPGEVMHNVGIRIHNEKIYFCDLVMRRMNIYDLKGQYLDEVSLNEKTGNPWSFDVTDDAVYFAGTMKVLVSKLDLKTGDIISIPMEREYQPGRFDGGTLTVNKKTGDVFLGYFSQPYRIEKFDSDLNRIMSITRKGMEQYDNPEYFRNEVTDGVRGSFVVSSLRNDGKYLYSANPNGQEYNKEWSYLPIDCFIDVYDLESGRYVKQIVFDKPEKVEGQHVIVDIREGKIFSLLVDHGCASRELYPEEESGFSASVVVMEL